MPLLLRRSAPSPSIDELAFAVPVAPLSSTASRSASATETPYQNHLLRCSTHGRLSLRRRRSTAGTELELSACREESCSDPEHQHPPQRASQPSMRHSGALGKTNDADTCFDSKRSSGETLPDDERMSSSEGSYGSEAERVSSVLSCGCSCADANEFCLSASTVVIEDRQLAVVDKELRDFRKTLMRKLYSRLTRLSGPFSRKKAATPKTTA
ncbi:hypothetical protein BBJ28_00023469 [Nothophytophthora sp. Chile5]|nr:hypothetical protein BBJ28_00023469 [Nothophytophthora sp. Chile5]